MWRPLVALLLQPLLFFLSHPFNRVQSFRDRKIKPSRLSSNFLRPAIDAWRKGRLLLALLFDHVADSGHMFTTTRFKRLLPHHKFTDFFCGRYNRRRQLRQLFLLELFASFRGCCIANRLAARHH
jgi:hypothetical protein